jgi:hypothetical protein
MCPLHSEANHVHMWIRVSNESGNVRESWKFGDWLAARRSIALKGQCTEFSQGFPWTWWTQREVRSQWGFVGTLNRSALSWHKLHKYSGRSSATSVCRTGICRLVYQKSCGLGWSRLTGTQTEPKAPAPPTPSSRPLTEGPNYVIREPTPGRRGLSQNRRFLQIQQFLHPALQMPSCPLTISRFWRIQDITIVPQSEDFTKVLELCSLRNGSRLVVNMAIMRKAMWIAYHCRSSLDRRCRRLNSRSDWLMDTGPNPPKPLTDGNI